MTLGDGWKATSDFCTRTKYNTNSLTCSPFCLCVEGLHLGHIMLDFSNGIHTHTQHMFGEVFFCFFSADDFLPAWRQFVCKSQYGIISYPYWNTTDVNVRTNKQMSEHKNEPATDWTRVISEVFSLCLHPSMLVKHSIICAHLSLYTYKTFV